MDANGVEEGGEGRVVRLNQPIEMSELEARIKKHLKLSQSKPDTPFSCQFDQLNLAGSPSRIFSSII